MFCVQAPTPNKALTNASPVTTSTTSTPQPADSQTEPRPESATTKKPEKIENLLPKRKTMPLAHVYNPLVQAFDQMDRYHEQMQQAQDNRYTRGRGEC